LLVDNFRPVAEMNITNMPLSDDGHQHITPFRISSDTVDRGEIEKRSYTGCTDTPDERSDRERPSQRNCPTATGLLNRLRRNYFFLMSKYHERLIAYIETS